MSAAMFVEKRERESWDRRLKILKGQASESKSKCGAKLVGTQNHAKNCRAAKASISGWDYPLLTFIYPNRCRCLSEDKTGLLPLMPQAKGFMKWWIHEMLCEKYWPQHFTKVISVGNCTKMNPQSQTGGSHQVGQFAGSTQNQFLN